MGPQYLLGPAIALALIGLTANPVQTKASDTPFGSTQAIPDASISKLLGRIWQVKEASSRPAPGSIYIFLANGTLLETSCVESYRIATWKLDKRAPPVLRVVEDQRLAFTAAITDLTDSAVTLLTWSRANEKRNITLQALEREYVCPDIRKQ